MDTVMDRERLAAFADGALDPEDAAAVVLHLEDCPADRAYVDRLMELDALLGEAYAAPIYEPVPERFRAIVFGDEPARAAPAALEAARPGFRSATRGTRASDPRGLRRSAGRPRPALWAPGVAALAASVALAVALGPWRGPDAPDGALALAGAAEPALAAALETLPSGPAPGEDGAEITLIATFLDAADRPCREFELRDADAATLTRGLACRGPEGWATEVAFATRIVNRTASGEDFVPAEGPAAGAISAALDRIGAGLSLTPTEEQALVANDWRP